MTVLGAGIVGICTALSLRERGAPTTTEGEGGGVQMTESEKAEVHRSFLLRQNEREERRLNRLEWLDMKHANSFEPALCTRSRAIVQN